MKVNIELDQITPQVLAEAFWGMSDVQQAQFFEYLHDATARDNAYGHGELQWCYLSDRLNENLKAKEQACAMLAWVFNRSADYLTRAWI